MATENRPNKIFIVDDSEMQLILLKKVLLNQGYDVKAFLSANKLLKAIQKKVPDLIISDIDMPVLNGFELVEKINKANEDIPCFLVSSQADKVIRRKAKAIGAQKFIEKPFELNVLLGTIDDLLKENTLPAFSSVSRTV